MQIAFPYRTDRRGSTATAGHARHIEDMIEQILFTIPGERVNRPDFGCGLQRYVFAGNADQVAPLQSSVHEALQRWLGERIAVEQVTVTARENRIEVAVGYRLAGGGESRRAVFQR